MGSFICWFINDFEGNLKMCFHTFFIFFIIMEDSYQTLWFRQDSKFLNRGAPLSASAVKVIESVPSVCVCLYVSVHLLFSTQNSKGLLVKRTFGQKDCTIGDSGRYLTAQVFSSYLVITSLVGSRGN